MLHARLLALALVVAFTSACAGVLVELGLGAERGRADLRWQRDDDGIVFLERKVRAPKGTVLMVHGFGGSKDHWTRLAARLPQDLYLVALDLPGFGESPKDPQASYTAAAQVARLKRFVDVHGLQRFHLMGNSMGGRIAAEYALAYPNDVASLVLFDPAGVTPPPGAQQNHVIVVQSAADFDALLATAFVTPPAIPDALKGYFAERAQQNAPLESRILDELNATPGRLEERLDALAPPTLVVWGAEDRIIDPAVAATWRAHLPAGDVVTMSKVGHAPMLERPEESAALVAVWWRRRGIR
ncbi:MAG: alpha/beta fold hydrolase [Deltaproteobacteria bacterium]|nr:alpha/beta fold hydrolase [Deltaproteobacteria bacterium]